MPTSVALSISEVDVDAHCLGSRWVVSDIDQLAKLVAIVAMGQARHAADIITKLGTGTAPVTDAELRRDAKRRLTWTSSKGKSPGSRWHRDGLIFEVISWCAAHQTSTGKYALRDPHLSSTAPGLDGFKIEIDAKNEISQSTIFEDKCSKAPRTMFRQEVMTAFGLHHANLRASDLVAAANDLLSRLGVTSPTAAARVLDKKYRTYRAALTVGASHDTAKSRKRLFKGYNKLRKIKQAQRVGATFVVPADLRKWFSKIAVKAKGFIDTL